MLLFSSNTFAFSTSLKKNLKIKISFHNIATYDIGSLTLRGECRLRVFENRILKQIYGPKWDENGK
jgi:hypothetical protein